MNIKRHFEPAIHVLSSTPESKSFFLFSLVIFIFLRLLLLWGYHNLFHITYLLVAFSFFQVTILSIFIMQKIKDALTQEEHFAIRKSTLLLGYIWSILLYIPVVAVWVVDLWQIQSGVAWPISNFIPDLDLLLIIIILCIVHFPLTISIFYWLWNCFRPRDEDLKLSLNKDQFRNRSIIAFFVLGFIFIALLGFKSTIEGEFLLPLWANSIILAIFILFMMIIITIGFYYKYMRENMQTR